MKRLKCPDCGGAVNVVTSEEGHVLGRCRQCGNEFVIDAKGRQHVIVEHRLSPDLKRQAMPMPAGAAMSRRGVLGLGGALLAGVAAYAVLGRGTATGGNGATARLAAEVIFNVGGEGAGAGQFREQVYDLGVDSLGRAALVDNRERVYTFDAEGRFVSHYPLTGPREGKFCAVLPNGNIILANNRQLIRLDMDSGDVLETVTTTSNPRGWGAEFCVTAAGGIAAYTSDEPTFGLRGSGPPVSDHVTIYGPDLREKRQMSNLLNQAIAPDPMVDEAPQVTAIAVDPAGSVYLNIRAMEDHDLRGGIFEFNADGVLQRRIEVDQSWHGRLAIGSEGVLWYSDPWRSDVQRITSAGRDHLELSGLVDIADQALGAVAGLALFPDGDLAITTMNYRYARIRPDFSA